MLLSIVIPVKNEEDNILPLYDKLQNVLKRLNKKYEIIFADDGSTDKTVEKIKSIKDKNIHLLCLRKSFGQSAALTAGFKHAKGDIIISMDGDLQNDPEDIPRLLQELNQGFDAVCGWRRKREDSFFKRLFSLFANDLRKLMTKEKIHDSGCTFRAYKKECVKNLKLYGEMHRYIPSLLQWRGYRVGEIEVKHHKRIFGKSKYDSLRLLKGLLDLIVITFWMRYSNRPMHVFGGLGMIFTPIGFLLGAYLIVLKFAFRQSIANRPLLVLSVLLIILGAQFFVFGIISDILIKIYYKDKDNYELK